MQKYIHVSREDFWEIYAIAHHLREAVTGKSAMVNMDERIDRLLCIMSANEPRGEDTIAPNERI